MYFCFAMIYSGTTLKLMEEAGMISATRYANKEVCGGAVAALVRYLLHTYDLSFVKHCIL